MKKGMIITLSITGGIATILVSVLIGVLIGNADLEENYTDQLKKVQSDITSTEAKLKDEESKLLSIKKHTDAAEDQQDVENKKLEKLQTEVKEVEKLIDQKDTITKEIDSLKKDQDSNKKELNKLSDKVKEKKAYVSELDDTIKAKEKEIEKLDKTIVQKSEEPIVLIAGQYLVGADVPEGRYQVTNTGDGTNFFVYDSSGMPIVNTILGDDMVGTGDYVFFTTTGDMIETLGPVKLLPIE
ncbi:hypothetical protein Q9251_17020 [Alkalihalobacillus macyae]|uniref:hypothetical protein n=1 Tax=Guptibacillus hwajinpoensis TaxID=208199 RepID=UPI00273BA253|nr:hypothetical protein [Alkalihalobacillus macyae]MDP4552582.1 hypothetical protein [Alkalihalobacillus macyae]